MVIICNRHRALLLTCFTYLSLLFGSGYYPLGENIVGGNACYNYDGNRLAIGISNPNGVRVYEPNEDNWTQIGSDILGDSPISWNGSVSVSISSSGNRVAVVYPSYNILVIDTVIVNDSTTYDTTVSTIESAQSRIFEYNGTDWIQFGNVIELGLSLIHI